MQRKDIYFSDLCLLGGAPAENAGKFLTFGIKHVEFMMDGGHWDNLAGLSKEMLDFTAREGVEYSLHSPCWDVNLSCEIDRLREASLTIALDSIAFASGLPCKYLVVHPGFCQAPVFDRKRAAARCYEALRVLCRRARESGVTLAVENTGYNGNSLYTREEFARLLDEFGDEAGYLLDIGHAGLNGWDLPAVIRELSGRLLGIHIHDNDGKTDGHLPMGEGVIDWQPVLKEFAALNDNCSLVLEYNYGVPLEKLVEAKRVLEAAL